MTPARLDRAALVALSTLPELGPARMRALLGHFGSPIDVVGALRSSRAGDVVLTVSADKRPELLRIWRDRLAAVDLGDVLVPYRDAGVAILLPGDTDWPPTLIRDPDPPALLFARGDPTLLGAASAAVVGTRQCTASGAATAKELGRGLAAAGVPVVSGLALGIDGIVHRAALDAGGAVIGIVATGLDRPYPSRHRDLWSDVARGGVLLSEAAFGVGPARWRFPARNRLIAACAAVVVVVESGVSGGSMITADEALERAVPVLAVPGPVRAPQSAGTNQLLFDGAGLARHVGDVLGHLGLDSVVGPGVSPVAVVPEDCREVHALLTPADTTLAELARVSDLSVGALTTALARLEASGHARRSAGGYRLATP